MAFGSHCVDPCRWEAVRGPVRCRGLVWVGLGAAWACATEISRAHPPATARCRSLHCNCPPSPHSAHPATPGPAQETLPKPAKAAPRIVRR